MTPIKHYINYYGNIEIAVCSYWRISKSQSQVSYEDKNIFVLFNDVYGEKLSFLHTEVAVNISTDKINKSIPLISLDIDDIYSLLNSQEKFKKTVLLSGKGIMSYPKHKKTFLWFIPRKHKVKITIKEIDKIDNDFKFFIDSSL